VFRLSTSISFVCLVCLQGGEALGGGQRPELDFLGIAEDGGGDGAANVGIEADVLPVGVDEAEAGDGGVDAANQAVTPAYRLQARRLHDEFDRHVDLDLLRLDDANLLSHDNRFRRPAGAKERAGAEDGQCQECCLLSHGFPPVDGLGQSTDRAEQRRPFTQGPAGCATVVRPEEGRKQR